MESYSERMGRVTSNTKHSHSPKIKRHRTEGKILTKPRNAIEERRREIPFAASVHGNVGEGENGVAFDKVVRKLLPQCQLDLLLEQEMEITHGIVKLETNENYIDNYIKRKAVEDKRRRMRDLIGIVDGLLTEDVGGGFVSIEDGEDLLPIIRIA